MVGSYGGFAGLAPYAGAYGKGDEGWHAQQLANQRAAESRIAFLQEHQQLFVGAAIAGGVLIAALLAFSGRRRAVA